MEPIEQIDRYLSNDLSPEARTQLETECQRNPDLAALLEYVRISRRAIQLGAIRAQVQQAQAEFLVTPREGPRLTIAADDDEPGGKVIPLRGTARGGVGWWGQTARIAASILVVLLGYGGYRLFTFDGQAMYADTYVSYQLPTTRGTNVRPSPLEDRYRAGDFAGVVRQADTLRRKTVPDLFLEASARLNLNQYKLAIARFEQARTANQSFVNPLFKSEIDYYLALALLGDGQYAKAAERLTRIQEDSQHPYHNAVSNNDLWWLTVVGSVR